MNIVDTIVVTCDVQWKQEVTLLQNYNTKSLINVLRQPLASSTEKQKELTTAYYRLHSKTVLYLKLKPISNVLRFSDNEYNATYNPAIDNDPEFPDYLQERLKKQKTKIQATGVTGIQMQDALIYRSSKSIVVASAVKDIVSWITKQVQTYSAPEAMYTLSDVFKLREEWRSEGGPFELFKVWHPEFPNTTDNLNMFMYYFDINFNIIQTLKNQVLYLDIRPVLKERPSFKNNIAFSNMLTQKTLKFQKNTEFIKQKNYYKNADGSIYKVGIYDSVEIQINHGVRIRSPQHANQVFRIESVALVVSNQQNTIYYNCRSFSDLVLVQAKPDDLEYVYELRKEDKIKTFDPLETGQKNSQILEKKFILTFRSTIQENIILAAFNRLRNSSSSPTQWAIMQSNIGRIIQESFNNIPVLRNSVADITRLVWIDPDPLKVKFNPLNPTVSYGLSSEGIFPNTFEVTLKLADGLLGIPDIYLNHIFLLALEPFVSYLRVLVEKSFYRTLTVNAMSDSLFQQYRSKFAPLPMDLSDIMGPDVVQNYSEFDVKVAEFEDSSEAMDLFDDDVTYESDNNQDPYPTPVSSITRAAAFEQYFNGIRGIASRSLRLINRDYRIRFSHTIQSSTTAISGIQLQNPLVIISTAPDDFDPEWHEKWYDEYYRQSDNFPMIPQYFATLVSPGTAEEENKINSRYLDMTLEVGKEYNIKDLQQKNIKLSETLVLVNPFFTQELKKQFPKSDKIMDLKFRAKKGEYLNCNFLEKYDIIAPIRLFVKDKPKVCGHVFCLEEILKLINMNAANEDKWICTLCRTKIQDFKLFNQEDIDLETAKLKEQLLADNKANAIRLKKLKRKAEDEDIEKQIEDRRKRLNAALKRQKKNKSSGNSLINIQVSEDNNTLLFSSLETVVQTTLSTYQSKIKLHEFVVPDARIPRSFMPQFTKQNSLSEYFCMLQSEFPNISFKKGFHVSLNDITVLQKNINLEKVSSIVDSVLTNGFNYKLYTKDPFLVILNANNTYYLLNGNHRYMAFSLIPSIKLLPVSVIDLSNSEDCSLSNCLLLTYFCPDIQQMNLVNTKIDVKVTKLPRIKF